MYSIVDETINEIEVEHSRFIGIILHCEDKDEIKNILIKIKKQYPKARHYCYAAKINDYLKSSDDGEPSGTAGRPLLDLIAKNNLNNIIIIVVRYFGGILLGAGRLLRTYVEAGIKVIEKANLYQVIEGFIYEMEMDYSTFERFIAFTKQQDILLLNKEFSDQIKVQVFNKKELEEIVENSFFKEIKIIDKKHQVRYVKEGN